MNQTESNAFEVEWRKLLISRLSPSLTKLNKAVTAEKNAVQERQTEIHALYPTEEDAHEAFGYGYITEDEYREIAEQLEIRETPTATSAARDELREILSRLRREVRDFEWEMKPKAERERIQHSNEKYKENIRRQQI